MSLSVLQRKLVASPQVESTPLNATMEAKLEEVADALTSSAPSLTIRSPTGTAIGAPRTASAQCLFDFTPGRVQDAVDERAEASAKEEAARNADDGTRNGLKNA